MNDEQQQKLIELYRRTRQEQPRAELDARIRDAAKRALKPQIDRWVWRLSTAAVLVLSFSVVLNLAPWESEMGGDASLAPSEELESRSAPELRRQQAEKAESAREKRRAEASPRAIEKLMLPEEPVRKPLQSRQLSNGSSLMAPASPPAPESRPAPTILFERAVDFGPGPLSLGDEIQSRQNPLPKLPWQREQLQALAEGLVVETAASGRLSVYHEEKLILTVTVDGNMAEFKAWKGAEILGVEVDWAMPRPLGEACHEAAVYTQCDLDFGATGYFEEQRLDHITWRQRGD